MASETSAQDLAILSTEFKALRDRKGHFNGGEHDKDVDGYGGKKHKTMEALAKALGNKGTPATKVLEAMGPPDEIVPKVGASNVGPLQAAGPGAITGGMPGPVIAGGSPNALGAAEGKPYFLIYYWRGRHDYLWFEVDPSGDEKINDYGWYAAGE
ncbi:uncharacterized protein SPPG_06268 [Spizellomyces punctatus DAOM BR117]|uniref:Uncharacterized protein n=1 Tax=Spizellomyces punctatus (strain DAOM BR117) TaxID=645134 RepID=A0A0L0HCZ3_SPIPD|nr:uncharacterized protein SPPG_06268 [Spizellomyces punctatus DAOM BR117]KNC98583.1 hypothetical protein SPPG_06268 [Spizellomyces punctatus DAOM BR117]|eukprot:XP_016606623.1 hypothetical protein SPPG_06268 [Spizellomyces punctatus DAOM BR117]